LRQKTLLAIAAALVVAMIVGLLITLQGDDGQASTGSSRTAPPREPAPSPSSNTPPATTSPAPTAPAPSGAAAPPATPVTPESGRPERPAAADDGAPEVRDHRGAGPTGPPSPLRPTTIASVRRVLEPQVRACAEGLEIASPPVRLVAHATLRARGGRVAADPPRITGADALGSGFADCVGRAYAALSTEVADGQTDGEDLVHMPFSVP
jgi:hypothetical protein